MIYYIQATLRIKMNSLKWSRAATKI